jgi:hypothetical protein
MVRSIKIQRLAEKKPVLSLAGKWLEEAGFPVGTRTNVEVQQGRIIITAQNSKITQ